MKEVSVGKTIFRLRKEKGITQEQLGNMIGISSGAVSKWETGNSKPDIDLLAPLARALKVSLNELLSFFEELSESEVQEIHKELTEIFIHKGFTEGEAKCKEYLSKYPSSMGLKYNVAGLLYMYSFMLSDTKLVEQKREMTLEFLYDVVESKDSKYENHALYLIANIQKELKNYEESESSLKKLKTSFVDPIVSYADVLQRQGKNKEVEGLSKAWLLMYLNQSIAMLSILSRVFMDCKEYSKAVFYLEAVNKIQAMFKIGQGSGAYNLCRCYIKQDKKDIAAKWFKKYVDELFEAQYDYNNNPYFENFKPDIGAKGQKVIRKKIFEELIEEENIKVLCDFEEYKEAIKRLKAAVKQ